MHALVDSNWLLVGENSDWKVVTAGIIENAFKQCCIRAKNDHAMCRSQCALVCTKCSATRKDSDVRAVTKTVGMLMLMTRAGRRKGDGQSSPALMCTEC